MSSYFFQMEGHASAPERVEIQLDDPAEACAHAIVAIGEMLRHRGGGFWNEPEWRIGVTDETGATLCTLTIRGTMAEPSEAAQPAAAARTRTGRPAMAHVA